MNFIFTTISGCGLWILFKWFEDNPQATVIGTAILGLAGVLGVFAFRFFYDLLFPDPPANSRYILDDLDD